MPTYAITSSRRRDLALLRSVAERSGGRLIDTLDQPAASAARDLTTSPPRVAIGALRGVTDLQLSSPFAQDGRVMLAGRLTEAQGSVELLIDEGGTAARRLMIPVRRAPVSTSGTTSAPKAIAAPAFAAQRWARLRVAALEADYTLHRGEVERLGKRFRLITRATSLIILDTAADYARHDIEPPTELRAEYERVRAAAGASRETSQHAHLEKVAAGFRERQAWWAREFPKGDRPPPVAALDNQAAPRAGVPRRSPESMSAERGSEMRDMARQSMPMPSIAPPPSAAAARKESEPRARMLAGNAAAPAAGSGSAAAPAKAGGDPTAIAIQLQPWAPDSRYARRLRDADPAALYGIYLDERASWQNSTAFYLDVADLLAARGQPALALRVLSNLAEMDLQNRHILRVLGQRLLQAGEPAVALPVLMRVRELSPNEPQSHRDLGLAFAALGQSQKAIDALWEVVSRPWHGRFPDVEQTALAELNAIVATAATPLDTSRIDPRLLGNLPLDLRAVLTWDADNTDIDLWVTDPNGEKAYYGNRLSYQGGRMSADFTGGYGPEEFALKTAKPGKYRIEAQFYGHRQQIVASSTTLQVRLTTRFGTAAAKEQMVTLRLKGGQEVVRVGEFEVAPV